MELAEIPGHAREDDMILLMSLFQEGDFD